MWEIIMIKRFMIKLVILEVHHIVDLLILTTTILKI